jgi:hypothetical protein
MQFVLMNIGAFFAYNSLKSLYCWQSLSFDKPYHLPIWVGSSKPFSVNSNEDLVKWIRFLKNLMIGQEVFCLGFL